MNTSPLRLCLVLLVCLLSIVASLPSICANKSGHWLLEHIPILPINLGLDLRGGSHLLLEVEFDKYLDEQLNRAKDSIKKSLRVGKIKYNEFSAQGNTLLLHYKNHDDKSKIMRSIREIGQFVIDESDQIIVIKFSDENIELLRQNVINQSIEIIRRRVDETGTKEPIIHAQGKYHILLQVPGLENPESLKAMLGKTAKLTFHMVNHDINNRDVIVPSDSFVAIEEHPSHGNLKYILYKKVLLTGDMLKNAQVAVRDGQPHVDFEFDANGARIFAEITKENIGKQLAIVLDNQIISAPSINTAILGGSGYISGNFTFESASDLALLLRAGALPAPLKIIEERTVGPSLGNASIEAGRASAIIGIVAVMAFMIWTYGIFGVFANVALLFNMLFLISCLAIFQATLTMPGIAGIVLTMGMAVDANVLIFERIKEEVRNGYTPLASVNKGFEQAFATILDSNVTTIVAALFLYSFGTGVVRGFSVTLIIGILCSMFSAITLTKMMVHMWLKYCKPNKIQWI
jgi:preprotein translocase subunit SecD